MYLDNINSLIKYRTNVFFSIIILFLILGISARYTHGAHNIQKILALIIPICMVIKFGLESGYIKHFIIYLTTVFLCYIFSDQNYVDISPLTFLRAVLGFGILYVIMLVKNGTYLRSLTTGLVLLPLFMVLISSTCHFLFNISVTSGGNRYGAGISSAHFAFLTYFVILFLAYESLLKKRIYLFFIAVTLIMMLLSGSRGPLLAALLPIALLLPFLKLRDIQRKIILTSPLIIIVGSKLILSMVERSKMTTFDSDGGLNLSGREYAWSYFLEKIEGLNLFGGKLGSITKVTEGVKEYNLYVFTVPHNEFIRFYMELGIIGCLLFFLNIILIMSKTYRISSSTTRKFLVTSFIGMFILTLFDNSLSTLQSSVPFALLLKYIHFNEKLRHEEKI
jgi:O-antigen ligase